MASFYIFTIPNKYSTAFNTDIKYDYKITTKINKHFITGYMFIKDDDFNEEWYNSHNLCKIIFDVKDVLMMIDTLKEHNICHELGINPINTEIININNYLSNCHSEMPYISIIKNLTISIFKYKIYINSESYHNTLQYLTSLFLIYHSIICKKYTINNREIYCLQGFVFTENTSHDSIIKKLHQYTHKNITPIFNKYKVYELITLFENGWKTSINISDVFARFIIDSKKLNLG